MLPVSLYLSLFLFFFLLTLLAEKKTKRAGRNMGKIYYSFLSFVKKKKWKTFKICLWKFHISKSGQYLCLGEKSFSSLQPVFIDILKVSVNIQAKGGLSPPSWKRKGSKFGWHDKGACGKKMIAYFLFHRIHPAMWGWGWRKERGSLQQLQLLQGLQKKAIGWAGREVNLQYLGFGVISKHTRLLHGDAGVLWGTSAINVLLGIWRRGTLSAMVC